VKEHRALIAACVAATWLIWGSTYLAIKFALVSFPPFFGMGTRFVLAGGLLLAWTRACGRALPTKVQWRNAAIIGTLLLAGGMGGTAHAELTVASGLLVAFIAVMPAMIAILNLFFGVRPTRLETIGIAIGVTGVFLLTRGAAFSTSVAGLVWISVACSSWSVGSVLSQRRLALAPGSVGFGSEMLCGGVALLLLSAVAQESIHWPPTSLAFWSWVYLIVFGSLIAFNAYMILLERASAALASSYAFVNPVIAMLLGVGLGGETVTLYEWWAVAVIMCGVLLLLVGRSQKKNGGP
jgi:drug/metabolite transporter (DMT)-like permease